MFDIGLQELVLIFVVALLVFGPKNLPQLGRSLGRAMQEFRRASDEFKETIEDELDLDDDDAAPAITPAATVAQEPGGTAGDQALPDSVLDPSAPVAAMDVPPGEAFVAQRGARLFHTRDCSWGRRIDEPQRVYFKHVAEAKEAGLQACPSCEPWEPA
jgi:TatA/E family protein of Tat protein translocase